MARGPLLSHKAKAHALCLRLQITCKEGRIQTATFGDKKGIRHHLIYCWN